MMRPPQKQTVLPFESSRFSAEWNHGFRVVFWHGSPLPFASQRPTGIAGRKCGRLFLFSTQYERTKECDPRYQPFTARYVTLICSPIAATAGHKQGPYVFAVATKSN